MLASRRKQLTKLGKGNKPNATRPLSNEEVDLLYSCGYFGSENPVSLQRTVWWQITKHFGHRARDESRQLKFGDIKIEKDPVTCTEYLVWITERSTKTRTGEKPMGNKRAFNPKAFSTGTYRCPVRIYKLFISHRPENMCNDESPLFLGVRHNIDTNVDKCWYFPRPMGRNSIGEFLSKASAILSGGVSNFKGKVENHSARKTSITNLLNENVNPLYVTQLSGHKKLESLNNYNVASNNQQRKMSNVLSCDNSIGKSVAATVLDVPKINNTSISVVSHPSSENHCNNLVPQEFQQKMMETWNPVLPPTFQGANISNCT